MFPDWQWVYIMTFNEFLYANIGSKLASSIWILDGINFKNYLNETLEQCFAFQQVDKDKVGIT